MLNVEIISGLPPPSVRISDALEKCPIKVEYFKTEAKCGGSNKDNQFSDKLLNALDGYLDELRPKKYTFVTDGIETKTDISRLGMTGNQLKKANKVSSTFRRHQFLDLHTMMIPLSVSESFRRLAFLY